MFLSPATISKTNLSGHSQVFKLVINMLNNVWQFSHLTDAGGHPATASYLSRFQVPKTRQPTTSKTPAQHSEHNMVKSKHNQVKEVNYMHTSMFTFHMFILTTGRNIFW